MLLHNKDEYWRKSDAIENCNGCISLTIRLSTVNRRGMVWIVGGAKKYVIVLCFGESRD